MTRFVPRSQLLLVLAAVALTAALLMSCEGLPMAAPPLMILGLGLVAWWAARSARFRGLAFTVWIVMFAASAWCYPRLYLWPGSDFQPQQLIVPLVQLIMFGMGVTLSFEDFGRVLKMPKPVFVGVLLQYTIMPLMAWTFAELFGLDGAVAAGLVLIGSCPGGVASNVIAYVARVNVALSVTMTACSTMLAPLATPAVMQLIADQYVPIQFGPMMISILKMILLPVLLGLLANRYAPRLVDRMGRLLPPLAMLSICVIIAITIALARDDLRSVGWALLAASVCHNAAGYTLGYGGARLLGLNQCDCRTVALEVGLQNGGMATGLALDVLKSPAAALGSAVFGPWSATTSSVLASYWRHKGPV